MRHKAIKSIILLVLVFVIYYITSSGKTPYDYFVRLAVAFTQGRNYLVENPPWLNELIPISKGFAVVYPPAPAILFMPFVLIFKNIEQQYMAQIMGALLALVIANIISIRSSQKSFFWAFLLAAFGNIVWYLSSNGSVWYLGQVSGALFVSLGIYESLTKRRPLMVSLFMGMAFLSRIQTMLVIPLIIYLNWNGLNLKRLVGYLLPFVFAVLFYLIYNHSRFGSVFETGYSLIPGVLQEPWYSKGIFHYSYIPNNLRVMFTSMPIIKNEFPFITPSWGGLAIWITTPAFLYFLIFNLKDKANWMAMFSLIATALITFSHGGTGFTQFGYRYAVDFYPLIYFIIGGNLKAKELRWHHWLLLVISIIVNTWGVLFINKFGWVSF